MLKSPMLKAFLLALAMSCLIVAAVERDPELLDYVFGAAEVVPHEG